MMRAPLPGPPKPPYLIEEPHLPRPYDTVAVQIRTLEPVVDGRVSGLVLLAQDEPHKVFVSHLPWLLARELAGDLG